MRSKTGLMVLVVVGAAGCATGSGVSTGRSATFEPVKVPRIYLPQDSSFAKAPDDLVGHLVVGRKEQDGECSYIPEGVVPDSFYKKGLRATASEPRPELFHRGYVDKARKGQLGLPLFEVRMEDADVAEVVYTDITSIHMRNDEIDVERLRARLLSVEQELPEHCIAFIRGVTLSVVNTKRFARMSGDVAVSPGFINFDGAYYEEVGQVSSAKLLSITLLDRFAIVASAKDQGVSISMDDVWLNAVQGAFPGATVESSMKNASEQVPTFFVAQDSDEKVRRLVMKLSDDHGK